MQIYVLSVSDLYSAAQGRPFPDIRDLLVDQSWKDVLQGELDKEYMMALTKFVSQEASGTLPIYPPPAVVFNAFNSCPFEAVKVVILGQVSLLYFEYHLTSQRSATLNNNVMTALWLDALM